MSSLRLDWCSHDAAKYAVEHWHYSRRMPRSKLAKIGAWEDGAFVGAVIFGVGATSEMFNRYGIRPEQGAELVRVAFRAHRAPMSRVLSIAIRMIKRTYPGLRLLVSFADPEQGHSGVIYQASGWIYAGMSQASDEYLFLGRRWQGRAFRHRFKGLERDPRVTIVKGSSKYRYLMPLDEDMKRQIQSMSRPYPSRERSSDSAAPAPTGEGGVSPTRSLHPDHARN